MVETKPTIMRRGHRGQSLPPKFNLAQGWGTLTQPPPFTFEGTVLHFFPLLADPNRLQAFCDSYINVAPEFSRFKPAGPYVQLIFAHYPYMGMAQGNLGYASQDELLFAIPLEWHCRDEHGQWQFRGMAQLSPFIFVNDLQSQAEGREVFGWPKVLATGWTPDSAWIENPLAARTLLQMETGVIPELKGVSEIQERPLVWIRQQQPPSLLQVPPGDRNMANLLGHAANVYSQWNATFWHFLNWFSTAVSSGAPEFLQTLSDAARGGMQTSMTQMANTVNLKQFRDAQNVDFACYQAITNASMEFKELHHAGLLGDLAQLSGDLSGGYEIELRQYASNPIIDSFGLKTLTRTNNADGSISATVRPTMPFFMNLDICYAKGETICWRSADHEDSCWRNDHFEELNWKKPSPGAAITNPRNLPDYVTAGSTGLQVPAGPFDFAGFHFRVMPLLANRERMQSYVQAAKVNEREEVLSLFGQAKGKIDVEVTDQIVYMVVGTFKEMRARPGVPTVPQETTVRFLIPVRVALTHGGETLAIENTFVCAFLYTTSGINATSDREITGLPAQEAQINSMPTTWAQPHGPGAPRQPLLSVDVSLPASINTGQPFQRQRIIEIMDGFVQPKLSVMQRPVTQRWNDAIAAEEGRLRKEWHERVSASSADGADLAPDDYLAQLAATLGLKPADDTPAAVAQALHERLVARVQPFHIVSLKQFRDCSEPDDACYQSIVFNTAQLEVTGFELMSDDLHVHIYDFTTQPILGLLGLQEKAVGDDTGTPMFILRPLGSFCIHANVRLSGASVMCSRAGNLDWVDNPRFYDEIVASGIPGASAAEGTGEIAQLNPEGPALRSPDAGESPFGSFIWARMLRYMALSYTPDGQLRPDRPKSPFDLGGDDPKAQQNAISSLFVTPP